MINLLPYDLKKQTAAARINAIIFSYILIISVAAGFVALTFSTAYMFLSTTKTNDMAQLNIKKTAKVSVSSTQGQVDKFKDDLTIVKNVLDRQVSYSDIIIGLGNTLPQGSVIESLSINDSSLGSAMNLKIRAASPNLETKIKESFSGSTIFSGYNLVSSSEEAGMPGYPTAINISIIVNRVIKQ